MKSHISVSGGGFTGSLIEDTPGPYCIGSGFRPLVHSAFPSQNIYRDEAIGLNFEHVLNGVAADVDRNRFTPRTDTKSLQAHSDGEVSVLHRAEDSTWGIESSMRYELREANAVDMTFSVTKREDRFQLGYVAFMWASYMNRTRERRIHFYGECDERERWLSFGDQLTDDGAFETGTVSAVGVPDLPYEQGADTLNLVENPRKKFLLPFYYGLVDGDGDLGTTNDTMVYVMMFDQTESIRFAMWNFIRDAEGKPDPHSPAWDWHFVIREPVVDRSYGYRARMLYKPFVSRDDVRFEYERWRAELPSSGDQ